MCRISRSSEETEAFGAELARMLRPGEVVLIHGDLGVGKSVLVRGVVRALPGGEGRAVRSPTFVYIHQYPTVPPVHHVDLYRLPINFDPADLGLEEITGGEGVTLIEWAQRLGRVPNPYPNQMVVRMESLAGEERRIEIEQN